MDTPGPSRRSADDPVSENPLGSETDEERPRHTPLRRPRAARHARLTQPRHHPLRPGGRVAHDPRPSPARRPPHDPSASVAPTRAAALPS